MYINIIRVSENSFGIFSFLEVNGHKLGYTLELPDIKNRQNISCIPRGIYGANVAQHRTFGKIIKLYEVPNRYGIYIHTGNKLEDTQGCILPGLQMELKDKKKFIYHSRNALNNLLCLVENAQKLFVCIFENY